MEGEHVKFLAMLTVSISVVEYLQSFKLSEFSDTFIGALYALAWINYMIHYLTISKV